MSYIYDKMSDNLYIHVHNNDLDFYEINFWGNILVQFQNSSNANLCMVKYGVGTNDYS